MASEIRKTFNGGSFRCLSEEVFYPHQISLPSRKALQTESNASAQTFIMVPVTTFIQRICWWHSQKGDHTERTYFISNNDRIMCANVWFMHGDWTNTRNFFPRNESKYLCDDGGKRSKKNRWKLKEKGWAWPKPIVRLVVSFIRWFEILNNSSFKRFNEKRWKKLPNNYLLYHKL